MALNIKTIYARNIWILMLYSAFHMLGGKCELFKMWNVFFICALNCVLYIYTWCVKCSV